MKNMKSKPGIARAHPEGAIEDTQRSPERAARVSDASDARTESDSSSESILLNHLDDIPLAVLVADLEGRVVYLNSDCAKLFGYSPDEVLGHSIELFVPEAQRQQHVNHRRAYSAAPVRRLMGEDRVVKGVRKDGTEVHLEVGLGVMHTSLGSRVFATIQDITQRRYYEEKLRDANNELAGKNADLDEFAYMASHDLQEPLRKLISFSELLPTDLDCELNDEAAADLKFIIESAYRMRRLVQDLLTLSRAGKDELRRTSVDLGQCVTDALSALETRVREVGAIVQVPGLPTVDADPVLTTQLFQNLIGNALKFVSKETHPVVEVTIEDGDDGFVFGVKDNGIGIAPEFHSRVFGAFRRLHTRAEYDGSGVGLSICRKAVERHGGRIWVESEPGAGAHFRFTLGDD